MISWPTSVVFLICFFSTLGGFHPLLWWNFHRSRVAGRKVLEAMNATILALLQYCSGTTFEIIFDDDLPNDTPLLIVSNHQSMFDIPLFIWHLRSLTPQFVAKKELGSWIPSISLSLRKMGSALIDRNDRSRTINELREFGARMEREKGCVVLFPEGTRARDGKVKPFRSAGFYALMESMPSAKLVPVSIRNSYLLLKNGLLPVPYGVKVTFHVGPALPPPINAGEAKKILKEIAQRIERQVYS